MRVLGIETSCDETGIAIYDTTPMESGRPAHEGLLSQTLHSQVAMHQEYGGVVPELASRDHIRRILPLTKEAISQAHTSLAEIDAVAFTQGPGLAGALLVGASVAKALAYGLKKPIIGIHHLEGHLLSPLLADDFLSTSSSTFPFLALLVSGGHTQIMLVKGVGNYELLGETLDDAAGEAFDKTAKLLGLSYPGGPAVSALAKEGLPGTFKLPRPMIHSKDLDFSFAGLKTAVLTQIKQNPNFPNETQEPTFKANLARDFVDAVVDVLTSKILNALKQTNCSRLVVAGGVGANQQLRTKLNQLAGNSNGGFTVHYPPLDLCTDNGAMIAFAGALRLMSNPTLASKEYAFDIKPRWPLAELIHA